MDLSFPKTINVQKWTSYLGRNLTIEERSILTYVRAEKRINQVMKILYKNCDRENLYIPFLTAIDGNCLFESLNYYGIGKNIKSLRKGLAYFLLIYKNVIVFEGNDRTLKQIFDDTNEIKYVKCTNETRKKLKKKPLYYKYTYDVMCQDLTNSNSWTRINTQLLLMVISLLYKVDIYVVYDTYNKTDKYMHNINIYDGTNVSTEKVYLGLIDKYHYFPLDKIKEKTQKIYYTKAKRKFFTWGQLMEQMKVRQYVQQLDIIDSN